MTLQEMVQPYTMASPERINRLIDNAIAANENRIEGDMVECGVCNGGSAAVLAYFATKASIARRTWLFDSFEGLPATTKEDLPSANGNTAESCIGQCVGSIETVKQVLSLVGADMRSVNIIKGWFTDTFPKFSPQIEKIAMLNLDSDWYESEKLCLETFYDKVVEGGFIYFDDFFYWPGCRKAVEEFFAKHPSKMPMFNRVGHSMWLQKGF